MPQDPWEPMRGLGAASPQLIPLSKDIFLYIYAMIKPQKWFDLLQWDGCQATLVLQSLGSHIWKPIFRFGHVFFWTLVSFRVHFSIF